MASVCYSRIIVQTEKEKKMFERLIELVSQIRLNELVSQINTYSGDFDDIIMYELDEFLEQVKNLYTTEEIIAKTLYGDINLAHDYFKIDNLGNFASCYAYEYEEELIDNGGEIIQSALDYGIIDEEESQELLEELHLYN